MGGVEVREPQQRQEQQASWSKGPRRRLQEMQEPCTHAYPPAGARRLVQTLWKAPGDATSLEAGQAAWWDAADLGP